jgi:hypothetical protein
MGKNQSSSNLNISQSQTDRFDEAYDIPYYIENLIRLSNRLHTLKLRNIRTTKTTKNTQINQEITDSLKRQTTDNAKLENAISLLGQAKEKEYLPILQTLVQDKNYDKAMLALIATNKDQAEETAIDPKVTLLMMYLKREQAKRADTLNNMLSEYQQADNLYHLINQAQLTATIREAVLYQKTHLDTVQQIIETLSQTINSPRNEEDLKTMSPAIQAAYDHGDLDFFKATLNALKTTVDNATTITKKDKKIIVESIITTLPGITKQAEYDTKTHIQNYLDRCKKTLPMMEILLLVQKIKGEKKLYGHLLLQANDLDSDTKSVLTHFSQETQVKIKTDQNKLRRLTSTYNPSVKAIIASLHKNSYEKTASLLATHEENITNQTFWKYFAKKERAAIHQIHPDRALDMLSYTIQIASLCYKKTQTEQKNNDPALKKFHEQLTFIKKFHPLDEKEPSDIKLALNKLLHGQLNDDLDDAFTRAFLPALLASLKSAKKNKAAIISDTIEILLACYKNILENLDQAPLITSCLAEIYHQKGSLNEAEVWYKKITKRNTIESFNFANTLLEQIIKKATQKTKQGTKQKTIQIITTEIATKAGLLHSILDPILENEKTEKSIRKQALMLLSKTCLYSGKDDIVIGIQACELLLNIDRKNLVILDRLIEFYIRCNMFGRAVKRITSFQRNNMLNKEEILRIVKLNGKLKKKQTSLIFDDAANLSENKRLKKELTNLKSQLKNNSGSKKKDKEIKKLNTRIEKMTREMTHIKQKIKDLKASVATESEFSEKQTHQPEQQDDLKQITMLEILDLIEERHELLRQSSNLLDQTSDNLQKDDQLTLLNSQINIRQPLKNNYIKLNRHIATYPNNTKNVLTLLCQNRISQAAKELEKNNPKEPALWEYFAKQVYSCINSSEDMATLKASIQRASSYYTKVQKLSSTKPRSEINARVKELSAKFTFIADWFTLDSKKTKAIKTNITNAINQQSLNKNLDSYFIASFIPLFFSYVDSKKEVGNNVLHALTQAIKAHFKKDKKSGHVAFKHNLANLYFRQQNYQEAITWYKASTSLSLKESINLAKSYSKIKQPNDAITHLKSALNNVTGEDPAYESAHVSLWKLQLNHQKFDVFYRANLAQEILQIEPTNTNVLRALITCFIELGRFELAAQTINTFQEENSQTKNKKTARALLQLIQTEKQKPIDERNEGQKAKEDRLRTLGELQKENKKLTNKEAINEQTIKRNTQKISKLNHTIGTLQYRVGIIQKLHSNLFTATTALLRNQAIYGTTYKQTPYFCDLRDDKQSIKAPDTDEGVAEQQNADFNLQLAKGRANQAWMTLFKLVKTQTQALRPNKDHPKNPNKDIQAIKI